jgi:hypothetical protein
MMLIDVQKMIADSPNQTLLTALTEGNLKMKKFLTNWQQWKTLSKESNKREMADSLVPTLQPLTCCRGSRLFVCQPNKKMTLERHLCIPTLERWNDKN